MIKLPGLDLIAFIKKQNIAFPPPPPKELAVRGRPKKKGRPTANDLADDAWKVECARRYVQKKPGAVSGDHGHNAALDVAIILVHGFALPRPDAKMLFEEWNATCTPPWNDHDVGHKLTEAENKQNPDNGQPRGWRIPRKGAARKRVTPGPAKVDALASPGAGSAGVPGDDPKGGGPVPDDDPSEPLPPDDEKPQIVLRSDEPGDGLGLWTGQYLEALGTANDPPKTFQRGGRLVRLRRADTGQLAIEALSLDALRGVMDRDAHWGEAVITRAGDEVIRWGPVPVQVVKDFASLAGWDPSVVPVLDSVVESPRFRPDGSLILEAGYHADARVYYDPAADLAGLAVPEAPTESEVGEAVRLILGEFLHDFLFEDAASRANAMALMLLPFVRLAVDGPTPIHMIEAAVEGTGKGKLAWACAFPSLGRDLPSTPQKENEGEWRKAITSALMGGATHFFVDNMFNPAGRDDAARPVDSASLASATTQLYWQDRILGGNREACVGIHCVFVATGNNVEWSRELARRVVTVRLLPGTEDPSSRTGFRHDPIEAWARANRGELVLACLTICRNWVAKGRPAGAQTFGSYESYAAVMGGILDACGVPGFLGNRGACRGKDRESLRWEALVAAWHSARGERETSAGDLYDLIFGHKGWSPAGETYDGGDPDLRVAFIDIVGEGGELSQKQRLGNAITKQRDRVVGGFQITRADRATPGGSAQYRLRASGEPIQGNFLDD